ncbi:helix-turn-helix domain-containing protein [Flavobacterium selenitireducens]|uniref:helix-turn-helix domain-containing protein n=1 Tax=Flavobacterium selenitireducens TaxID=2722704 RepID=UPI00168B644C|nr:helix-turn-helix transcriptional regulator [Flavobacterium selenitireducens]MBD3582654.1 helix-turn-helix transcriptional regulator [Flavobacterium selenitireducens]
MKKFTPPVHIATISEMHRLMSVAKPFHPLVSVVRMADVTGCADLIGKSITYGFFSMALKKNFDLRLRYGRQYYDFDEGVMTFVSPLQVIGVESENLQKMDGFMLLVHPDFLKGNALHAKMPDFGFFSYDVNEALHVSDSEEKMVIGLMESLEREIANPIDAFSQDVILSHIELLLNYSNRFYNRQFLTRKTHGIDVLSGFERLLKAYLSSDMPQESGLPSVHHFAEKLHLSSNYLSDLLRSLTGRNARQHIQDAVVEKAKELLATTNLSVSEIAFKVGFEHSQSFNKLFKSKVEVTPLEYRMSFG